VEPGLAELVRVFTGGSRSANATDTWVAPMKGTRLLIQIAGTGILSLDVEQAETALALSFAQGKLLRSLQ